jgi:peptidoglycan/xylan/chitin deacetylase (PgdA/CDA1 family)
MNARQGLFSTGLVFVLALLISIGRTPASAHSPSTHRAIKSSDPIGQLATIYTLQTTIKSGWGKTPANDTPGERVQGLEKPLVEGINSEFQMPVERTVFPDKPAWLWNPPGEVTVPILMYHHVGGSDRSSRYNVSEEDFTGQMQRLRDWGYTTISLSLLVESLQNGAHLPPRPLVISFDDGYLDVYEKAWPVMQAVGFTGVVYVITGQMEITGYLHADHLKDLVSAGWEIGSHTDSHSSLRENGVNLEVEISGSQEILEAVLGVPVSTFSFPYGLTNPYVTGLVKSSGYESAVGLGGLFQHVPETQYYLSRIEVQGEFDLQDFADLLPWSGAIDPQPLVRNEIP